MSVPILLASGSTIRAQLLHQAGVAFTVAPARIDEETITAALLAEGASPRDIADALAEGKARKIGERHPDAAVLGCDQVLAFKGDLLRKPASAAEAVAQLAPMRGETHDLFSAVVIYYAAQPIWRRVGHVRLRMRAVSDAYLEDYAARKWPGLGEAVGGYKLEEEGARLFARIDGDYFSVLGIPMLDVLGYLTDRGWIDG